MVRDLAGRAGAFNTEDTQVPLDDPIDSTRRQIHGHTLDQLRIVSYSEIGDRDPSRIESVSENDRSEYGTVQQ